MLIIKWKFIYSYKIIIDMVNFYIITSFYYFLYLYYKPNHIGKIKITLQIIILL